MHSTQCMPHLLAVECHSDWLEMPNRRLWMPQRLAGNAESPAVNCHNRRLTNATIASCEMPQSPALQCQIIVSAGQPHACHKPINAFPAHFIKTSAVLLSCPNPQGRLSAQHTDADPASVRGRRIRNFQQHKDRPAMTHTAACKTNDLTVPCLVCYAHDIMPTSPQPCQPCQARRVSGLHFLATHAHTRHNKQCAQCTKVVTNPLMLACPTPHGLNGPLYSRLNTREMKVVDTTGLPFWM